MKKKGESGDNIYGEREYSNKSKLKKNLSNYRKNGAVFQIYLKNQKKL